MNSSLRLWKTFASAIFTILVLTASANALDDADYRRLDNLWHKALQLENDITNAQQDARGHEAVVDCFDSIYSHLERVEMSIGFLTKLAAAATAMVDKFDEKIVLDTLKLEVKSFFNNYINTGRIYTNKVEGTCSENYIVAVKAQEVLRFYNDASSVVRSIVGP
jgi:hypothetical protein